MQVESHSIETESDTPALLSGVGANTDGKESEIRWGGGEIWSDWAGRDPCVSDIKSQCQRKDNSMTRRSRRERKHTHKYKKYTSLWALFPVNITNTHAWDELFGSSRELFMGPAAISLENEAELIPHDTLKPDGTVPRVCPLSLLHNLYDPAPYICRLNVC